MKIKKLLLILILAVSSAFVLLQLSYLVIKPPLSIIIYGDTRTDHLAHQKITKAIMKTGPDIVFHTGDLVEDGRIPQQWQIFNSISSELLQRTEFYPALGNHEYNSPLYFDNFQLPNNERWYVVKKDDILFIVLDSNSGIEINSEQYQWLEATLKNVKNNIKFIIAIFHHPIFGSPTLYHFGDEKKLKDTLVPLFKKYSVSAVFSGHNHNYERSFYDGIYYIITGGGGAPLHERLRPGQFSQAYVKNYHFCKLTVAGNQLIVEVLDSDLNLIDYFKLTPRRK